MSARVLDGKALAQQIKGELAQEVDSLVNAGHTAPGLAVLLIGDDPASGVYVRNKEKSALAAGMRSELVRMPADSSRSDVLGTIDKLASDPGIHGMLVQLPLPDHLDTVEIQRAIPADKDVDGFHPENAGKLMLGQPSGFRACTPLGVMALLELAEVDLKGAEAVVVGRSNIVGKPVSLMLLENHATVTLCHSRTRDLVEVCRRADVLVAAVGVPGLIGGEHVKPGSIVIDVGINRVTDPELAKKLLVGQPKRFARFEKKGSTLVGDVIYGEAVEKASAITPVPGGAGPLTVAMLLKNTVLSAKRAAGLTE